MIVACAILALIMVGFTVFVVTQDGWATLFYILRGLALVTALAVVMTACIFRLADGYWIWQATP